jgi:YHS domain-containing protein
MAARIESETRQGLLTVCGGRMDDPQKYPASVFQGKNVYFCNEACLRAFQNDPHGFMAGEIEHPVEDDPRTR